MRRVSVDIGGTFTDCFLAFDGHYVEAKALTTHHNLASGFMDALNQACADLGRDLSEILGEVDAVRYATTLGTNPHRAQRPARGGHHHRRFRVGRALDAGARLR